MCLVFYCATSTYSHKKYIYNQTTYEQVLNADIIMMADSSTQARHNTIHEWLGPRTLTYKKVHCRKNTRELRNANTSLSLD